MERLFPDGMDALPRLQGASAQSYTLNALALTYALPDELGRAVALHRRCIAIDEREGDQRGAAVSLYNLSDALWLAGKPREAECMARRALQVCRRKRMERDFIRVVRLQGTAALRLGDLVTAGERLRHALTRARAVKAFQEELPVLTALAELHRQRQDYAGARDLLGHLWEPARRGPYPMFHADALNVLAQIERDEGNRDAAIAAATQSYVLAWCDGPPYAYHYGLTNARKHLEDLDAPLPALPPFDPARFEPPPEVEINPHDEFHV